MKNVKDAEANDMIHMGSDHRCVMATFLIDIPERKNDDRRGNTKHETTVYAEQEDEAKENNCGKSELEKRYQEIIVTIKKAAAEKRKEAHDTRIDVKNTAAAAGTESTLVENAKQESEGKSMKHSSNDDSKSNTAAAAEAGRATVHTVAREYEGESKKHGSNEERVTAAALTDKSALVDMTLPETEGGSTVCSSEAAIPRGGSALPEHRRPDGWTSTPRGEDDNETGSKAFVTTGGEGAHDRNEPIGCSSSCDLRAGERLPKQRPLGDDHPERGQELHLPAQTFLQVVEAGSIVLQSSHDSSEIRRKDKSKQETTHNAAMKNDESVDKDAEITRLIEERREIAQRRKTPIEGAEQKNKKLHQRKEEGEKTS